MGFQALSVNNITPLFQTLISQNAVTSPVFSFKLDTSGSELYLGGMNRNLYTGDFTWVSLEDEVCTDQNALLGAVNTDWYTYFAG
jgi:Eukaryotic aspartyl protease